MIEVPFLDSFDLPSSPADPPPSAPPSADSAAIAELLGRVDQDLVRLVQYRTDLARQLVARRVEEGGLAYEHEQELAVVRRFRPLGPDGQDLARLLLRQAR